MAKSLTINQADLHIISDTEKQQTPRFGNNIYFDVYALTDDEIHPVEVFKTDDPEEACEKFKSQHPEINGFIRINVKRSFNQWAIEKKNDTWLCRHGIKNSLKVII